MAASNALYDKGRNAFLEKKIEWSVDDIRAILVDEADYTRDLAADEFLTSVTGAGRVAVSAASIAGKSSAAGVADATDHTIAAVSGDTVEAIVLYLHTGVEGTSYLIANIEVATGLPLTPSGTDVTLSWSNGASKIFKL